MSGEVLWDAGRGAGRARPRDALPKACRAAARGDAGRSARAARLVGGEPRGVLARALRLRRRARRDARRAGARERRHAGRAVVPRGAAQRGGEPAGARRGRQAGHPLPRRGRRRGAFPVLGRAGRAGGAAGRLPARRRRRRGGPRRRLRAERSRDGRGDARHRGDRGDLVLLLARLRHRGRARSLRSDRAEGAVHRERLPATPARCTTRSPPSTSWSNASTGSPAWSSCRSRATPFPRSRGANRGVRGRKRSARARPVPTCPRTPPPTAEHRRRPCPS